MRRAHRRTVFDWLGAAVLRTPYRCQECRHRFYVGGSPGLAQRGGFSRWKRKQGAKAVRVVVIGAVVLAAVGAFFAFLMRPPAP